MSHILLAIDDVELAIELTCAFEHTGHQVEHVFDVAEALLRAKVTVPDALVVDLDGPHLDHEPIRRWASNGVAPLVLMSTSWSAEQLARRLGAAYFVRPDRAEAAPGKAWSSGLIDVVEAEIVARMGKTHSQGQRSGMRAAAPVVLVAARRANAREIVSSFVRSQLGLRCVTASDASTSILALDGRVKAVLLDCDLLSGAAANALLQEMNEQSLPIILLRLDANDEDAAVGRAAWEAIPPLRDALKTIDNDLSRKIEDALQKTSAG
jgi:DNA-binding response OmpR family regulator